MNKLILLIKTSFIAHYNDLILIITSNAVVGSSPPPDGIFPGWVTPCGGYTGRIRGGSNAIAMAAPTTPLAIAPASIKVFWIVASVLSVVPLSDLHSKKSSSSIPSISALSLIISRKSWFEHSHVWVKNVTTKTKAYKIWNIILIIIHLEIVCKKYWLYIRYKHHI